MREIKMFNHLAGQKPKWL